MPAVPRSSTIDPVDLIGARKASVAFYTGAHSSE
jgi:hypothetical protein